MARAAARCRVHRNRTAEGMAADRAAACLENKGTARRACHNLDGDRVIGTPGGSKGAMIALDKNTGKEVWRCKEFTDPAQYSSPIVAEIDGVRQYIQLTEEHLVGVAAKDGKLLWSANRTGSTAV